MGVIVTSSTPNIATGTHQGHMIVSITSRQGPISRKEKNRRNCLGLCRYCDKPGHITIDHKDLLLFVSKR